MVGGFVVKIVEIVNKEKSYVNTGNTRSARCTHQWYIYFFTFWHMRTGIDARVVRGGDFDTGWAILMFLFESLQPWYSCCLVFIVSMPLAFYPWSSHKLSSYRNDWTCRETCETLFADVARSIHPWSFQDWFSRKEKQKYGMNRCAYVTLVVGCTYKANHIGNIPYIPFHLYEPTSKNARKSLWLVRLKIAQTILSTVRNPKQKWDGRVFKYIWTQMNTNYLLTFDRYKRGSFGANNASVGIDILPSFPSIVRTHGQLFF